MTLLYSSPRFLEHDTGRHPECDERLRAVSRRLEEGDLWAACERPAWEPATLEQIARVHSPEHAQRVRDLARRGGGRIEADTVVSPASYDVALLAAGAVCDAVRRVVTGDDNRALCLVRPPGHHALRRDAMGFCLFNNVAIGARLACAELDVERVLIVDWDVHHGNGTQDTFWEDPRVAFLSIHRWPFYPGSGDEDETGGGRGLGTTANLPVTFGTPREVYLDRLRGALEDLAAKTRPQLLIVSAGFDSHRLDPIGSLGLETEDFGALTQIVREVAHCHAGGRLVSVLEGGYNPPVLAECLERHLEELIRGER